MGIITKSDRERWDGERWDDDERTEKEGFGDFDDFGEEKPWKKRANQEYLI